MKYMLLIYEDQAPYATASEADQGKLFQGYMDFTKAIQTEGKMVSGDALQPSFTATTVQVGS